MLRILRVLGWILIIAAFYALWLELLVYFDTGVYEPGLLWAYWYVFSPSSLNFIQDIIQRYLFPELWDPVIVTILLCPAWVVLGVPGLLIEWRCRRRRHRYFG
jgi:hypothetical protein